MKTRYLLSNFLYGILCMLCVEGSCLAESWAILAGVDNYQSRQITPLNFAVSDAKAMAQALKEAGVPEENVFLLTDSGKGRSLATGTNIIWRMSWLAERTQPGDTLYFFFSGHGLEREGSTYLLSYDSDIGNSVTLKRTAVRMSELKEITKAMKVSNVITFMDACRNNPEAGKSVGGGNALSKGMAKDLTLVGPTSSPANTKKLHVTYFSCSPGERSWESEETGQGFFTYHILKGLKGDAAGPDGKVTVNSLEGYLSREVSSSVDRELGHKQNPWTSRNGTAGGEVVLVGGPPREIAAASLPQRENEFQLTPEEKVAREEAVAAFEQNEYDSALPVLKRLAAKGDPQSQYLLGMAYTAGLGVEKDSLEGHNLQRLAASSGYADAQVAMGLFYENGESQDLTEAIRWYRRALNQGHKWGQFKLARAYEYGVSGTEKNLVQAANLYHLAAKQGLAEAQHDLGEMLMDGRGVTKDYAQAQRWLRSAVAQNYPPSLTLQGYRSLKGGFGVTVDVERGLELLKKSASFNDFDRENHESPLTLTGMGPIDASAILGLRYYLGDTVKKDYQEAAKWLQIAADRGFHHSQFWLGHMYATGKHFRKNHSMAAYWYKKSATQGHEIAANNLAVLYEDGKGLPRSLQQALYWYMESKKNGNESQDVSAAIQRLRSKGIRLP